MAKVCFPERIWVGDHVIIDDFALVIPGAASAIGSYVHIASFCSITGGGAFFLEDFSALSAGCRLVTGSDDFKGPSLTNPTVPAEFKNVRRSYVRLGRHALLGTNTVVLPGVTIGEGATVGANSLVTRDLEPWTVNIGTPARAVKARPRHAILDLERQLIERYGALPRFDRGQEEIHDAA
jgi:galactoside O-acetyltransferase